jgi:hypothetical protein
MGADQINIIRLGTITEIMGRFQAVPYEQFQKELNEWFVRELSEKGLTADKLTAESLPDLSSLPELVGKIYQRAELLQTLADAEIKTINENK